MVYSKDDPADIHAEATAETQVPSIEASPDNEHVRSGEQVSKPASETGSWQDVHHKGHGSTAVETIDEKLTAVAASTPVSTIAENAEQTGQVGEDESKYPRGFAIISLTFGLCLTFFVVALDNTIIATAIPKITQYFNSLGDVGWYGSSYLLTQTALQPTFGKIYAYFNVKWTFLTALAIFELGSVLCAAATSSRMLIVGRAMAGVGSAGLFSGSLTIVGYSVPLRKRAIFIGIVSSMFGIASIVGPILGGVLTDRLVWRWCFWINLPIGAVAFGAVLLVFRNPQREHTGKRFREKLADMDLVGAVLLICAVVCLLLALQWGGTTYPWHDSKVWGNLLGFGLIVLCFITLQFWRKERATIPPHVLGTRSIWTSCLFMALFSMAIYAHVFYLPFYFQAVLGTTAEGSGIRTIPFLVSNTLGSIFTGSLVTLLGPYLPFMWAGSILYVIGAGLLYTLKVNSTTGQWIGFQILAGGGSGICIQIPFIIPQVVLSSKDMPIGNSLAIFFNSLGGALSVSIAQNIFSNELLKQLVAIPTLTLQDAEGIINAGATAVRGVTPPGSLEAVLEAYDFAITHAFILAIATSALACIATLGVEWKSVKGKKLAMGAA